MTIPDTLPASDTPDYEREEAQQIAQASFDDDMWEAYARELEHHHKRVDLSPWLKPQDHTEGATDDV